MTTQEKQEQGVKGQFISSIAAAKERIRAARGVLGLENTEVRRKHRDHDQFSGLEVGTGYPCLSFPSVFLILTKLCLSFARCTPQDCSTDGMSLTDQLAYFEMEADAMKKVSVV